jgi:hypothetical protein
MLILFATGCALFENDDLAAHTAMCEAELGRIPGFQCEEDGVRIPVFRDGVQIESGRCDDPALLDGSCDPDAYVGHFVGRHADGTPRPEVEYAFLCRNRSFVPGFENVAMIGHNRETGATCFWETATMDGVFPSPSSPDTPTHGSRLPVNVITTPGGCEACHVADPWIHSPWIDGARRPDGSPIVPIPGPDEPYRVLTTEPLEDVAFPAPRGNACLGCHRVDCTVLADAVGPDGWMPPAGLPSMEEDADQLLACCDDPDAEGCNVQHLHGRPDGDG